MKISAFALGNQTCTATWCDACTNNGVCEIQKAIWGEENAKDEEKRDEKVDTAGGFSTKKEK